MSHCRRHRARLGWTAAAVVAAGCGLDPPAADTRAAAITHGAIDLGDPAVVALVSGGRAFCTGTLVTPRVVVTAAHCLGQHQVRGFFGAAVADGGALRDVADQRAHPDFAAVGLAHDIGVILLAEPAPDAIAPVPMRREALPPSVVGAEVRLVGFGKTSADPGAEAGRKRTGTTTVAALGARSFDFGAAPSQTCMGDSGGPAFMTFDGVEVLVGITSAGDPRCEQYGRDTRVDAYVADFVLPYVDTTAAVGSGTGERCFVPDNCASGICARPDDAPAIGYCVAACASDVDCPDAMFCDGGARTCRYPAPSPGSFATACTADADCDSRMCARPDGAAGAICTAACLPEVAATCPADTPCVGEAGSGATFVCAPPTAAAGCAVGAGGGPGAPGALLAVALLVGLRRRRRAATRAAAGCAIVGGSPRRPTPRDQVQQVPEGDPADRPRFARRAAAPARPPVDPRDRRRGVRLASAAGDRRHRHRPRTAM